MTLPPATTVFSDADAVAQAVAQRLLAITRAYSGAISICLAGGSTPQRLYRLLATPDYAAELPWARLHWFWGDERFVPPDSPDSNTLMVNEALLAHVPAPAKTIHAIPTIGLDLAAAAAAYQSELSAFAAEERPGMPLFDLVLLGMGDDGHTASLFPGKPALDERSLWVAPVPEAGLKPFVPRITLTFPALASSREVLFLAVGAAKRAMLAKVAAGEDLPATHVTSQGEVRWWIDREAAGEA